MAKQLQLRRGTTSEHGSFTGLVGEVTVDTDKDTIVVHDGSTAAGFPLAPNASPTFTGSHIRIPSVTTANRPGESGGTNAAVTAVVGMLIYNSTLGMLQQYGSSGWAAIASPPTISSLDYPGDDTALDTVGEFNLSCTTQSSTTVLAASTTGIVVGQVVKGTGIPTSPVPTVESIITNTSFVLSGAATASATVTLTFNTQTLVIAGTDFSVGVTVAIDGTAPSTVTRNSSTQITVTGTPAKTAGTKVDGLKVTNASGLSATINVDYSALPAWTTASGNVLSAFEAATGVDVDLAATSATSYAITSGAIPASLVFSTSTGDITGTISASAATFNFTVTATDAEAQSASRLFNIIVASLPTGGNITTYTGFRVHTFVFSGGATQTFGNTKAMNVDYLIVAGGGAGGNWHGGGGGAGGVRTAASLALTAIDYTIVIGDGGTGGTSSVGDNGLPSSMAGSGFTTITATGGGRGGNYSTTQPNSGGSGAGGNGQTGYLTGAAGIGNGVGTFGSAAFQGYNGGDGYNSHAGGGGGGAGGVGETSPSNTDAGNGGDGISTFWGMDYINTKLLLDNAGIGEVSGSSRYVAGGGGGGIWANASPGDGGLGTTASGTRSRGSYNFNNSAPIAVSDNMGAGGSGSGGQGNNTSWAAQTTGGSGVVIIRYAV